MNCSIHFSSCPCLKRGSPFKKKRGWITNITKTLLISLILIIVMLLLRIPFLRKSTVSTIITKKDAHSVSNWYNDIWMVIPVSLKKEFIAYYVRTTKGFFRYILSDYLLRLMCCFSDKIVFDASTWFLIARAQNKKKITSQMFAINRKVVYIQTLQSTLTK